MHLTQREEETNYCRGETFQGMVEAERERQDAKWGNQGRHTRLFWLGILMEEVGELSKAIIECNGPANERELVQVAAVCQAIFEYKLGKRGGVE